MATAIEHRVIIPQNPLSQEQPQTFYSEGDAKATDIETSNALEEHDQNAIIEKLNTFMDTPSAGALNSPPPPYSQQDYYLEQLLQVLNGHLSQGGQKEKNGNMLDKMTQLESLVSSLQNILSDQTFAMHDLKSQLSDIQTLLKKMQDKQETMTSEDIMKQVVTMKALTENIMASSEVKRHLDESNTAAEADPIGADPAEITGQVEEEITDFQTTETQTQPLELPQIMEPTVEEIIPSFEPSSPLLSTVVIPPSRPVSRTTSRQTSRAPSRVQSRNASRAPSRSASRAVSPNRSPVLSRTSSKNKLELPVSPQMHPFKGTMGPISEDYNDDDEEEEEEDTVDAFERMASMLSTLITEATTAVEAPVKGREKKPRQDSNASVMSRDYFEDFDWDALVDDDASVVDQAETETPVNERAIEIIKEPSRKREKKDSHYRLGKSRKEEEFQKSFKTLDSSLAQVQCLISDMTEDLIMEEEAVIVKDRNGRLIREIKDKNGIVVREEPIMDMQYDPTQELLNNPSADLADLDDFAQQCRLLTRALILPFLHATHSFMSESLQSSNQPNAPRSVTSTTRTFMNLMYWTFLFTLGSLVLDSWLCEVAGRQVIRMVEMLKPGQSFDFVEDSQSLYEIENEQSDFQDNGMDDGKKKNVKFRTGFRLKSVSWRGVEMSVGSGRRWLRNSAQNVMSLGRRGRRLLTAGGWGFNRAYQRSMLSQGWDDEMSEDSEWEIVDYDDSTDCSDDDSIMEGDSGEEDPALTLRRRITDERLKRAGHVKFITYHSNSKKDEGSSIIQKNNAPSANEHCVDMQIEEMNEEQQQPLRTNEASRMNEPNLTSERDEANIMEEYEIDEDELPLEDNDVELQIPGSFPAAFRWAPSYTSTTVTTTATMDVSSDKENVRRVRSVVLRRPKRSGPFGGSGGFWVMKTHKVRAKSSKKGDRSHSTSSKKEKNASDLLKSSNTKSSPISKKKKSPSKRVWVRRNSI